jgi:hypothetical protein
MSGRAGTSNDRKGWKRTDQRFQYVSYVKVNEGTRTYDRIGMNARGVHSNHVTANDNHGETASIS